MAPRTKSGAAGSTLKRAIDILGSSLGLVMLSPWLLTIAASILVVDGRPILFRQKRAGLGGCIFKILKFRTMSVRRGSDGQLLPDQDRVTTLGKWLRRTSLDELPELLNIAAGDMSFVGPRPLFVDYLPLYNDTERRRHEVRPGLTGLAQIGGRNRLNWQDRFALDVKYVDEWTIVLDVQILARTISTVIRGRGVEAQASLTSEPFRGTPKH